MRKLILLALLLQLGSCSQWCDCQNSKADSNKDAAHSHEQSLSEQMQQDQQSIASTSVATDGTVIEDRKMAEAPPVIISTLSTQAVGMVLVSTEAVPALLAT